MYVFGGRPIQCQNILCTAPLHAGRPAREISHPIASDLQCILSICRTSRSAGRIGWSIAYACPRFIVGGQGWDVVRCRPAKRPHESSTNAGHPWANRTVGSICSARVRRSRSCRCVVTRMIRAVTEQNVNFTERYVPCHRTECKCHRTLCATSQNIMCHATDRNVPQVLSIVRTQRRMCMSLQMRCMGVLWPLWRQPSLTNAHAKPAQV